jgi:spore germination protein KC
MMRACRFAARLMLLPAMALVVAGCWNRTEVNDLAIVQLTSYDWEDDQYRIGVSFPLVSQMSGTQGGGGGTGGKEGQNNYLESAKAPAIRDAINHVQRKLSRRLYFAHRRVLLIGETAAERGVKPILDTLSRYPENRISTYLLVAKDSALGLMQTPVLTERVTAEMFREILVNIMKEPVTARDFIHAILTEGVDAYTLVFKRTKTDTPGKEKADTVEIDGLAVFRDDKMVGILEGQFLDGTLLALGQLNRPVVTAVLPEGGGPITAQFLEMTSRIEPMVNGDDIRMRITFSGIVEINSNETDTNLIHYEVNNEVTKAIERQIQKEVSAAVGELQTRFKADVLGFGSSVKRNHPGVWKRIGDRWRDLYPKVPVEYRFNIRMEHAGTLKNPIHHKAGEY